MSRVQDSWSIGEILSLLQDEFPEVTISKIRFLESQGLIEPERTASGYRQFTDVDYDRLYWILEQQRDHYLPLRVIRERLDEGQEIAPAPRRDEQAAEMPQRRRDDHGEDGGRSALDPDEGTRATVPAPPVAPEGYGPDPQTSGELAASDPTFGDAMAENHGPIVGTDSGEPHPVHDAHANPLAEVMGVRGDRPTAPSPVPAERGEALEGRSEEGDVHDEATTVASEESADAEPVGPLSDPEPPEAANDDDRHDMEMGEMNEPAATDDGEDQGEPRRPAPRLLGTRSEPPRPITRPTSEVLAPPPRPTLPGSSVALTREELAEQSGITTTLVDELEKHGLISPRQVGSAILFDSTALTIARLAVQFGRYGLEPRHLRTIRLGAEREVALLVQSIGPTLKANNPETRRRSYDTLQDLAELTASLRAIIVRDLIADHDPG